MTNHKIVEPLGAVVVDGQRHDRVVSVGVGHLRKDLVLVELGDDEKMVAVERGTSWSKLTIERVPSSDALLAVSSEPEQEKTMRAPTTEADTVADPRDQQLAEIAAVLKSACDREWEDETPVQIAHVAVNAIYWRDQEIAKLRAGTVQPQEHAKAPSASAAQSVAPAEPQTPEPETAKEEPARPSDGLAIEPPWCSRRSGSGWACTRPPGHEGQHVAGNSHGDVVYFRWPAAPVSSSGCPDRQTVEPRPGDACRFCPYPRDSRVHEADVEPKHGGHRFELRERPPNVVQEQADARPARTLEREIVALLDKHISNYTHNLGNMHPEGYGLVTFKQALDALLSGGAPHVQ